MPLRQLPIARPCNASFATMRGDAKKRFCASCDKHVHDLSAGTETEARAVLASAVGTRICVRYAKNGDGTIRFRGAAIAVALSLAACSSATPSEIVAPDAVNAPVAPLAAVPDAAPDAGAEEDIDMGDAVPDFVDVCPDNGGVSTEEDGCPDPS